MNNIVILKNIHKYFKNKGYVLKVLKGINLEIKKGDSIAIIGASGSGKTTLLNIIGGLEPPTKGRVKFCGENIYEIKEDALNSLRNKSIGFVFQFHYLLPELNALENVMMPALIAGYKKTEAYDMAISVLNKIGLNNRIKHRPGELSGGEQQRVAIARALVMKPKIILADEPTGNLDRNTGSYIAKLLLELNKTEGIAIVVATHNLELANMMCKIMELKDGLLFEK